MTTLTAYIEGVGLLGPGLENWASGREILAGRTAYVPQKTVVPPPALLPPAERRRCGEIVKLALATSTEAMDAAGVSATDLPSVFTASHGDGHNCHAICEMLASDDRQISPTRFHNSVHNAASGYWTIGVGSHAPSTAISAFRATLAQGLIEAAMQLEAGAPRVLLVAYDSAAGGPLSAVSTSEGMLGLAMVFDRDPAAATRMTLSLAAGEAPAADGPLQALAGRNAMAPALALLDALANERARCVLPAGLDGTLVVEIAHG